MNKLEDVEVPNTKKFEPGKSPHHRQEHAHKQKPPQNCPNEDNDRTGEGKGGKGIVFTNSISLKEG